MGYRLGRKHRCVEFETSRKVAVIASTLKLRITCSPNVSGFSAYLMSLLGLMTKKSIRLETLSLINFGGR